MDFQKSNKTRSHGEAQKSSRNSVSSSSPSPTSGSRPPLKDRVKSAPPAAQSSRYQNAAAQKTMTDLPLPELQAPEQSNIHQPSSIPILEKPDSLQQTAPSLDQVIPFIIQPTLLKQNALIILADELYRLKSKERFQRSLSQ